MKPSTVDQYVASLSPAQAALVNALRAVVKKAAPKATESFKWAQPVYELNGPMIWMRAFREHVNLGFWRGAEFDDPRRLLEGTGSRMRHLKFSTVKDIKPTVLSGFIRQAVKLNQLEGDPTRRMRQK